MAPAIMGNPDRPELGTELANSFCRTDPEIAGHFARVTFLSDNREDLSAVTVPTLILQCSDDIIAPTAVGEFIHSRIAASELVTLNATGHCPNLSAPEETTAAVKAFSSACHEPWRRAARADDRLDRLESDDTELYEQAPCAYLSTLQDGTIVRGNQTFFAWIGARAEDIVGKTRFQTLLTVGSRIYYETHYAPLLQMQGFVNEIALEVRRTDGAVRPIVASARQLLGAGGVPTINRVALFDSTDRRRYEQELLHARKRAEDAARALEAADAQKNEFIAMLAHELRNPLAPDARTRST